MRDMLAHLNRPAVYANVFLLFAGILPFGLSAFPPRGGWAAACAATAAVAFLSLVAYAVDLDAVARAAEADDDERAVFAESAAAEPVTLYTGPPARVPAFVTLVLPPPAVGDPTADVSLSAAAPILLNPDGGETLLFAPGSRLTISCEFPTPGPARVSVRTRYDATTCVLAAIRVADVDAWAALRLRAGLVSSARGEFHRAVSRWSEALARRESARRVTDRADAARAVLAATRDAEAPAREVLDAPLDRVDPPG